MLKKKKKPDRIKHIFKWNQAIKKLTQTYKTELLGYQTDKSQQFAGYVNMF